ncbi:MAG: hypothetical protein Q4G08_08690 [Capnocytophaga sp.]|nr:hypothetical protein [Capnocytophaga sp.]
MIFYCQNNVDTLEIKPFRGEGKQNVLYSFIASAMIGLILYWADTPDMLPILGIVTAILLFLSVLQWIIVSGITVIFDKKERTVYRRYWNLFKIKVIDFDAMTLLKTNSGSGEAYSIAAKTNRYRSKQRISRYLSEKKMLIFETEIVPEILPFTSKNNN